MKICKPEEIDMEDTQAQAPEPEGLSDEHPLQLPQELVDLLGEAVLGDDYRVVIRGRRAADHIRRHRETIEHTLDETLRMFADPDRLEPQEHRMGITAVGFQDSLARLPGMDERIMILLTAALERLAALDPETRLRARHLSLAQVTPAGTRLLGEVRHG